MAIVSFLVFATAFGLAGYSIWATVAPKTARIAALLSGGREFYLEPLPALPRGTVRALTVRAVPATAQWRAVA